MKVSKFIGDLRKILKTTGDVDNFITDSDNRNIVRRNKGIEYGEIFLVIS